MSLTTVLCVINLFFQKLFRSVMLCCVSNGIYFRQHNSRTDKQHFNYLLHVSLHCWSLTLANVCIGYIIIVGMLLWYDGSKPELWMRKTHSSLGYSNLTSQPLLGNGFVNTYPWQPKCTTEGLLEAVFSVWYAPRPNTGNRDRVNFRLL
jgi:hypothetical protein